MILMKIIQKLCQLLNRYDTDNSQTSDEKSTANMKVYLGRKQTVQRVLSKMKVDWVSSKSTQIQAATNRLAAKDFYEILKLDYDLKQRKYSQTHQMDLLQKLIKVTFLIASNNTLKIF